MNRMVVIAVTAVLMLAASAARASAANLSLVCDGHGSNLNKLTSLPAQVQVKVEGDSGKMKLPSFLHNVNNDDWSVLSHVTIGDDEIRGRVSIGILANPLFSIDRHTGSMELDGGGISFTGLCRPAEVGQSDRLF